MLRLVLYVYIYIYNALGYLFVWNQSQHDEEAIFFNSMNIIIFIIIFI